MIQLQFLNYILNSKDTSLITLNNLSSDFFSDYRDEYKFIENHIEKYGNIPDKETFLNVFPSFDLVSVSENSSYLIDELYRDYSKRNLATVFNKIRDLLVNDKVDDAIDLYNKSIELTTKAKHIESFDLLNDTSRYESYIKKCTDFSKFYIKTGFKELDKIIGGWDRQEELATIAARPGIGKSWVLLKCAIASLEQGLTVGIYSGEMSEVKVGYRFDTLVSHISNYSITRGIDNIQNEYKKYIDSLSNKFQGKFKVLTPSMINGPAGVRALRAFIEKDNLDVLFVDQHSLLEDDRKAKNPVERAANISKDLKNLQVMTKIPIIAVSQQNRADIGDGVSSSNIAQSDRIAQDSTIVIFLEQKDSVMTMTLSKSRDSETNKKLKYAIDLNKGIFDFIPEEQDDNSSKEEIEALKDEYEDEVEPF